MRNEAAKRKHTRGRGSNPASRRNLHAQKADAYVLNYGTDGMWHILEGPIMWRTAYDAALRLEAMNHTGKPQYVATRSLPKELQ